MSAPVPDNVVPAATWIAEAVERVNTAMSRLSRHEHSCPLCLRSWMHTAHCEVYGSDDGITTWTWTDRKVCRECRGGS